MGEGKPWSAYFAFKNGFTLLKKVCEPYFQVCQQLQLKRDVSRNKYTEIKEKWMLKKLYIYFSGKKCLLNLTVLKYMENKKCDKIRSNTE